jgi:hypothetical protein
VSPPYYDLSLAFLTKKTMKEKWRFFTAHIQINLSSKRNE